MIAELRQRNYGEVLTKQDAFTWLVVLVFVLGCRQEGPEDSGVSESRKVFELGERTGVDFPTPCRILAAGKEERDGGHSWWVVQTDKAIRPKAIDRDVAIPVESVFESVKARVSREERIGRPTSKEATVLEWAKGRCSYRMSSYETEAGYIAVIGEFRR